MSRHFTKINDKHIEDNAAMITTQRLAAEWLGMRLDVRDADDG